MPLQTPICSSIKRNGRLSTPADLKKHFPVSQQTDDHVHQARKTIINIINKHDPRLLIICGPCSIHDPCAALEYAEKLKLLAERLKDELYIVMRAYFEKPRTTIGWKGFINDPYHNGTCDIEQGLYSARALLTELTNLQIPVAIEALDPAVTNYLYDLVSWVAIGARTTESQIHRELASSLPMPVGFKNGTDGNVNVAINAIKTAAIKHYFIGLNQQGRSCIMQSNGNQNCHIILRGGHKPNYYRKTIALVEQKLKVVNLPEKMMVDCSHGNSGKNYLRQINVAQSVANQLCDGNQSIIGLMFESYLKEGSQDGYLSPTQIEYGISVTDGCIGWQDTESLLIKLAHKIRDPLRKRYKNV